MLQGVDDSLFFSLLVAFITHVTGTSVKADADTAQIVFLFLFFFLFCFMRHYIIRFELFDYISFNI